MKNKRSILILAVIVLGVFSLLITALKDFLVNSNQKVQGNIAGSTASTSQYYDWSEMSSIDNDYSYSTLFYTKDTKIYVNSNEEDKVKYRTTVFEDGKTTPAMTFENTNGKGQFIITNCALGKDGNLMDVVIDIKVNSLWGNGTPFIKTFLRKLSIAKGPQSKPVTSGDNTDDYTIGYNNPLVFGLNARDGSAKVKLTYYKDLKLKNIQNGRYTQKDDNETVEGRSLDYAQVDTANSVIATDITKVNSFYGDIDVTAEDDGQLFNGDEGVVPINGSSSIYYSKTGATFFDDTPAVNRQVYVKLEEGENGIYIDQNTYSTSELAGYNTDGIWYGTGSEFLTDNLSGSYEFVYTGSGCGIGFAFFSPKDYSIDPPIKKVSKNEVKVGETFYYTISQYIPNNYLTNIVDFSDVYPGNFTSNNYISKLQFKDTFDEKLTIDSDHITIKDINGTDLSQYFGVSVTNNVLTTTEKALASQYYRTPGFYNNLITITVPARYLQKVEKEIDEVPNTAYTTTKIGDGEEGQPVPSNTVKVNVRPLKLIYDCTTNGGTPKFNPITYYKTQGEKVSVSTTEYTCVKENNRFIGWAEEATDTKDKVLTTFTMPGKDTTLYALYEPITCDLTLTSSVYTINEEAATVNVPKNHSNEEILKNVSSTGEIKVENEQITVTCNGDVKVYKISRYWIAQTGQKVIKYTFIIIGLVLLIGGLIFLNKKIDNTRK